MSAAMRRRRGLPERSRRGRGRGAETWRGASFCCRRGLFLRIFGGRRLASDAVRADVERADGELVDGCREETREEPFAAGGPSRPVADRAVAEEDLSPDDLLESFEDPLRVVGVPWERAPTRGRSCVGRGWRLTAGPPRAT